MSASGRVRDATDPGTKHNQEPRALNGCTVLVVDDNPDALDVLRLMVEHSGAKAVTARNGAEALSCVRGVKIDLVLCDLGMPVMSGYEFIQRLHAERGHARTPVIAVSAYVFPEDLERAAAAGFASHLAKPVNFGLLEAEIRRVLVPG
jgi:two-component system CheB/CheR fusion protein